MIYFQKSRKSTIPLHNRKNSPYELGKALFGKYGSGKNNLSKDYKKPLKGKLHEKYSR